MQRIFVYGTLLVSFLKSIVKFAIIRQCIADTEVLGHTKKTP